MKAPEQKGDQVKRVSRHRRAMLPYLILGLGLAFTFLVSYYFSRLAETRDQSRFNTTVQEVDDRLKVGVQTSIALLRAGTGLFAASDEVTIDEFDRFVNEIELQKYYQGIQGIGFSRKFSPEEKPAIIAEARRSIAPDFHLWPDSERNEYHSILFLNPHDEKNKVAVGFDMFTESVRREAMEHARDTGMPTASGRVVLVQEMKSDKKQAGFLIYAPVYKNGAPVTTADERRKALLGFVYSPFRADDFIAPLLADKKSELRLDVYDGNQLIAENLLHSSDEPHSNTEPHFSTSITENVGGRVWTLRYETKPSFELSSSRAFLPYLVGIGCFLSVLLFGLTLSEVKARANAEIAVSNLRESEARIRHTLADRAFAEEALRESEERYRDLVENANDIVFVMDKSGRLTATNKAAEAITGFSTDELMGKTLIDILSENSRPAAAKIINPKAIVPERENFEVDVVSKSGKEVTLEVSSKPIFKGTEHIGVQGIARDISARRRGEEALRQADQRALSEYERLLERISSLAQALGTARDLTTIFRALHQFTDVSVPSNGLFVSLYDPVKNVRTACYGWGDGAELDVSELPTMPVTWSGPNSRAVRTGQVVITEDYMKATRGHPTVIVGADNGLRPQSSMVVPMAVMGRIIGTIEVQSYEAHSYRHEHETAMRMAANLTAVAIENVRLLKRESSAREAAEQSNRLKDEFLATVSHELRTPLTAILGWARLLEAGSLDEDIARQAIETIWRNAKSQAEIIDDILDVSRIITGNLYLDLQPVELNPVVEAAINVVRPTADARRIKIETNFAPTPAVVSGDATRLQQVIWNLLSNAVKFSDRGGSIRLGLETTDGRVEFTVEDTGHGISKDFLPYVFDRFRQADSSTTRQHGGLGLGLAIARHLVEIHGGTIRAESNGPGHGATFTMYLPLIEPGHRQLPGESEAPKDSLVSRELLNGLHILIVDDDEDTLELMATALSSRQANVTAVSSADEALDAFKTSRPDVVVTDIAMPEEDGYGLIANLRELEQNQTDSTPAIAITAYAKEEDRLRALSSGFQLYLAKPIEITDLVSAVARAARREFEA